MELQKDIRFEVKRNSVRGVEARNIRLKLSDVSRLKQIRSTYDPNSIDELAKSMIVTSEDGGLEVFVMSDPWVAMLDKEHAQSYLDDLNTFYADDLSKPYKLEDIAKSDGGNFFITINGHRRQLAIMRAHEMIWHVYNSDMAMPDDYLETQEFDVKALVNIDFITANQYQAIENVSEKPPPRDDADEIYRLYKFLQHTNGKEPSSTELAEISPYTRNKILNGLHYARLPGEIKDGEKSGYYPYSIAVTFGELQSLYYRVAKRKNTDDQESANEQAQTEIVTFYRRFLHEYGERLKEGRAFSSRDKSAYIEREKQNTRLWASFSEELFISEDTLPAARRANVNARLAEFCVKALGLVFDELSEDEQENIRSALIEKLLDVPTAEDTQGVEGGNRILVASPVY